MEVFFDIMNFILWFAITATGTTVVLGFTIIGAAVSIPKMIKRFNHVVRIFDY